MRSFGTCDHCKALWQNLRNFHPEIRGIRTAQSGTKAVRALKTMKWSRPFHEALTACAAFHRRILEAHMMWFARSLCGYLNECSGNVHVFPRMAPQVQQLEVSGSPKGALFPIVVSYTSNTPQSQIGNMFRPASSTRTSWVSNCRLPPKRAGTMVRCERAPRRR